VSLFPNLNSVPTRALSVRQPWAHAITSLGKTIENRGAHFPYAWRGPVLIHASSSLGPIADFDSAVETLSDVLDRDAWLRFRDAHVDVEPPPRNRPRSPARWRPRPSIGLGQIVGVATVVAAIAPKGLQYVVEPGGGAPSRLLSYAEEVWWTGGRGIVLEDARPLPFVTCTGALGYWEVPLAVRRALVEGSSR
jgi:hypothetical protein